MIWLTESVGSLGGAGCERAVWVLAIVGLGVLSNSLRFLLCFVAAGVAVGVVVCVSEVFCLGGGMSLFFTVIMQSKGSILKNMKFGSSFC